MLCKQDLEDLSIYLLSFFGTRLRYLMTSTRYRHSIDAPLFRDKNRVCCDQTMSIGPARVYLILFLFYVFGKYKVHEYSRSTRCPQTQTLNCFSGDKGMKGLENAGKDRRIRHSVIAAKRNGQRGVGAFAPLLEPRQSVPTSARITPRKKATYVHPRRSPRGRPPGKKAPLGVYLYSSEYRERVRLWPQTRTHPGRWRIVIDSTPARGQ
ncbi:hypothetical protein B0H10DRAFT_56398 [Mycena sp. CBHHK59/15]|nr:hypothetical protein B0H10DRAFT_56398 [Mycena sp. CBHHK59/15]